MGLRPTNATTPGSRGRVAPDFAELTQGNEPEKSLTEHLHSAKGRNHYGRITSRFRGGGHKRRFRMIDFRRNKIEIRHAVEKLWNVDVVAVRTSIVRGKEKRMGRYIGRRQNWKKAIVTIAPGQNIEFFEGV